MDQLINNFNPKSLSNFFQSQISSFVPKEESLSEPVKDTDKALFSKVTKHGETYLKDTNELLVFSCKYRGSLAERSSRRKQFEIAKKVLKEDFKDGAIFVFYDNEGRFRFSFIRKNWGEKGDKRYSSWNRFTYFVDPTQTNKTFKERVGNCKFTGLDEIQEAFSVTKLTKEFYNDLFKWYQWSLSEEIGITFPNNTAIVEDDRIQLEEQIIRLSTRLLFVWFIKQKKLVPSLLFNKDEVSKLLKDFDPQSSTEGNYYNAILQNLFFATLNKAISERDFAKLKNSRDIKTLYRYEEMFSISRNEVLDLFKPIPFLNGGLFECLDKEEKTDGVKYALDGFSRNSEKLEGHFKHRAFIPNCIFFDDEKGLIPLLERYNFTVEENAPNEVQVALDPELLGNVFENLLGAFNAETKETARKQSGSFYTPREIVNYMVNESLTEYLVEAFPNLDREIIEQLFELEELPKVLTDNHTLCEQLSKKLRTVKILDPACGSGAFPMGVLNKMVEVLQKLDCNEEKTIYDQKLHLIEQCIYGVDLQTIAAQISKLRFFISLICEQGAMNETKENYGVLTLPNLETKFVAANTLIGIKRKPAQQNLFENPEIENTKKKLLEIRKEHFYAKTANAKKRLRELDADLRDELINLLQENDDFVPEDAVQFSKWNPYDQNSTSPFFDPEWMFGLDEGFNIVIGNPPYLRIQGIRLANSSFADYLVKEYKSASGSFDLYTIFVEKSLKLINPSGIVNFIMPTKWTNAAFGLGLRQVLSERNCAKKIINFGAYQVFNASTYTGLQWFKFDSEFLDYIELNKDLKSNLELTNYLKSLNSSDSTRIAKSNLTKEIWTLTSKNASLIIDKLNRLPRRIGDVFEKIFQGLATSKDDVYFLYQCQFEDKYVSGFSKQLNQVVKIEKEFTKPLLKGEDVHRYDSITTNRVVIFPYNLIHGNAELYTEEEIIKSFPEAYSYLKKCEDELRGREKGRY